MRAVNRRGYVNLAGMIETIPIAHSDALQAAAWIAPHCAPFPLLTSHSLDALSGAPLVFKQEYPQCSGVFTFCGVCKVVWSLPDELAERGVVTHLSAHHGVVLVLAARMRGIVCAGVVPEGTAVLVEPAGGGGCWLWLILSGSRVDVDALPQAAA